MLFSVWALSLPSVSVWSHCTAVRRIDDWFQGLIICQLFRWKSVQHEVENLFRLRKSRWLFVVSALTSLASHAHSLWWNGSGNPLSIHSHFHQSRTYRTDRMGAFVRARTRSYSSTQPRRLSSHALDGCVPIQQHLDVDPSAPIDSSQWHLSGLERNQARVKMAGQATAVSGVTWSVKIEMIKCVLLKCILLNSCHTCATLWTYL